MKSAFVGTLKFAAAGMRKPHSLHRPTQNPLHNNISVLNFTGHGFMPRTKSLVAFNGRIQTRSNSQLPKPSNQNNLHGSGRIIFTPLYNCIVISGVFMLYVGFSEKHGRNMRDLDREIESLRKVSGDQ